MDDLEHDIEINKYVHGTYFDHLENEILEKEKEIIELIDSYNKIKENLDVLIEKKIIHEKCLQLISTEKFQEYRTIESELNLNNYSLISENGLETGLNIVSGVVNTDDELRLKRMVFRASKGRSFVTLFDISETMLLENGVYQYNSMPYNEKKIYTIFLPTNGKFLLGKIINITDIYNCSRYIIPNKHEIKNIIEVCNKNIEEQQKFLKEAEGSIRNNLRNKFGTV